MYWETITWLVHWKVLFIQKCLFQSVIYRVMSIFMMGPDKSVSAPWRAPFVHVQCSSHQ